MSNDLCIKQEGLENRTAGLLANICKYLDKKNIDLKTDTENDIVKFCKEVSAFESTIYHCDTEEKFQEMEKKLEEYINFFNKLD